MANKPDLISASEAYKKQLNAKRFFLIMGLVCIGLFMLIGLTVGAKRLGLTEVFATIFTDEKSSHHQIIMTLRLPRLLAAILSGASLALAGAVMQLVLRNPLGSPFTLGISNASAFGAALAYICISTSWIKSIGIAGQQMIVTVFAFVWATIGAVFILFIARKKGATPENMILTGIIINTFFMALTSVIQFLADDVQLGSIVFWTFGDLSKTNWNILLIQAIIIIPTVMFLLRNSNKYNALDSGDQIAHNLGINVHRFRMVSILAISLLTACIVSFYGIIAFIGLVIPHVVRIIFGNESRFLLLFSMVLGALFLLACDLVSRSIFNPVVVPVGIITSIIGAPLFVILLLKGSKRWSK